MGDIADDLIDQMWDRYYEEGDLEDVFCKFCYRGPFDWEKQPDGRWRLVTQKRKLIHHCKEYENRGNFKGGEQRCQIDQ
jgi:hypothetical protein